MALLLHVFTAIHTLCSPAPLHLVTVMSHRASYPIPHTLPLNPLFATNCPSPLISAVVTLSHHFLCFCSCSARFLAPVFHKTLAGVQLKRNRRCRPKRSSATGECGARPTAPQRSWGKSCDPVAAWKRPSPLANHGDQPHRLTTDN